MPASVAERSRAYRQRRLARAKGADIGGLVQDTLAAALRTVAAIGARTRDPRCVTEQALRAHLSDSRAEVMLLLFLDLKAFAEGDDERDALSRGQELVAAVVAAPAVLRRSPDGAAIAG
jgi:hypothetical protein